MYKGTKVLQFLFQGSVVAMGTFYPLDTVRSRLQCESNNLSQMNFINGLKINNFKIACIHFFTVEENRKARNTFSMLQELTADEGL